MPSIEGSGFPLVFKVPPELWSEQPSGERQEGQIALRVYVWALTGM